MYVHSTVNEFIASSSCKLEQVSLNVVAGCYGHTICIHLVFIKGIRNYFGYAQKNVHGKNVLFARNSSTKLITYPGSRCFFMFKYAMNNMTLSPYSIGAAEMVDHAVKMLK